MAGNLLTAAAYRHVYVCCDLLDQENHGMAGWPGRENHCVKKLARGKRDGMGRRLRRFHAWPVRGQEAGGFFKLAGFAFFSFAGARVCVEDQKNTVEL